MYDLVYFTFDLITIDEKTLAKKLFDIVNHLHYFGESYYNYDLVKFSIIDSKILESIIEFMGEDKFVKVFEEILLNETPEPSIYKLMINLVLLKKYKLLVDILQLYIVINNYHPKVKTLSKYLLDIKEAIRFKDRARVLRYIDDLNYL